MLQNDFPRFITEQEMQVEELPWGPHDWLCRPELTGGDNLSSHAAVGYKLHESGAGGS